MAFKSIISTTCICLAFVSFNSNAALIVDQNQEINETLMAGFLQPDLAQSFQQSNNNIAGAGIFLSEGTGSTDAVTISLWDALPTQEGSMLATGSGIGTQGSWFDVFWNPVSVVPNTNLFLVFSGNSTLGIAGSTSNPYTFGQVYANSGFDGYSSYDYTFRTYTDDGISAIPVPAAAWLFGSGLLSLVGIARRKKA